MLKPLLKSAILTSGTKGFSLVMAVGTLAITSRELGPSGRGYLAVLATSALVAATLGGLSLGQVAFGRAGEAAPSTWLGPTVGVLAVSVAVVSAVTTFTVIACLTLTNSSPVENVPRVYLLLILATIPMTMVATYVTYLLLAIGKLGSNNRAQASGAATVAVSVFVLMKSADFGIGAALSATLLGQAVIASWGVTVLRRNGLGRPRLERAISRRLLRGGMELHLTTIGTFLFASLDVIMVSHFRGTTEAGYFQVAFQLFSPLLLVPQALTDVLGSKLGTFGVVGIWAVQRRLIGISIVMMTTIAIALAFAAPDLIRLVSGDQYSASASIFSVYLWAVPGAVLNGAMAIQWLGRGLFKQISVITLTAGMINLAANFALIPQYGAKGAAWATVFSVYALPVPANLYMYRVAQRSSNVTGYVESDRA